MIEWGRTMKYKTSMYNIVTENFDGCLLIANLLHTQFVKIKKEQKKEVKEELNKENISLGFVQKYPYLLENKFIVPDNYNEYEIALLRYNKMVYSNDALEITIIPTDACNFKCVYCYQEERDNKFMQAETKEAVLRYLEKNAKIISIDSKKYADLLPFRTTDYIFDPEKFSDLEGKTAPYLLYSTIRIRSLLNKAYNQNINFDKYITITTDVEKQIIHLLLELPRILLNSYNSRSLNDISEYIYNITSLYNKFYSENKVLLCDREDVKKSWLYMSKVVYNVNMLLLDVMGLKVPDKM